MNPTPDTQLEMFDLPAGKAGSKPRQAWWVIEPLRLRADHAMLGVIMMLVAGSVVFAVGIERGKVVARTERRLDTMATTVEVPPASKTMSPSTIDHKSLPASPARPVTPSTSPAPNAVPGMKKPAKSVAQAPQSSSKYAVQVVSYSQPQLAKRELQRLQERGEDAFLLVVNDHTVLMVGPFGSRDRASQKVSALKQYYRDCFVRTL